MSNSAKQMQSWQVFHFCRKHLGRSALYAIFGRKCARTVDRWCEDPRYTIKEDGAFDPLSGLKEVIDLLDDRAHTGIIRAMIAFLLAGTSLENMCGEQAMVIEPKETLMEEQLLDFRAVDAFHRSIDSGGDEAEIERRKVEAVEEIERTYARHLENRGGD